MTDREIDRMLAVARGWVGYLEKQERNYKYYDSKGANAGLNNWTRFGRIADIVLYGKDRRVKDGYAWCAMFIMAVLYEMKAGTQDCTVDAGKMVCDFAARKWVTDTITCGGGDARWHAGVKAWYSSYRHNMRISDMPAPGDFVVYLDRISKPYHIGIVESVDGFGTFTTIEGNTTIRGTDIVANGGAVARKKRKNNNCVFLTNNFVFLRR